MSVHEAHIDLWFFAREKAVVIKHVLNNDKLSTVAAVNESQNSEIEMVSWQVRLTDQVRYHQRSSSVFVGARLNGLLAPPALKLKNWNTEKFANPLETGVDPTHKGLSPLVFVGHNALWISDKAKPFCTYNRDSACNELCAWQDGNEYLRIKWARLFSPLKRNRRVPAETLSRIWRMSGNL